MNRRRFLTASGGAIAAGAIGVLGYFRFRGARVSSATDVVLSPGDEGTLTITWKGVRSISYQTLPDSDGVEIAISDVELSPPPDLTAESFPPIYLWRDTTAVEMTIPVVVAADVDPGYYHLVLQAAGPTDNLQQLLEKETNRLLNSEAEFSYPSQTLIVIVTDS